MYYFGYFTCFVLGFFSVESPTYFNFVFLATCLLAIFQNRYHINIVGLLTIILLLKIIEIPLWMVIDGSSNYKIFGSYFLIDIPVILLISFRAPLSRMIEHKIKGVYDPQRYVITNADLVVGKIYIIYCAVNFLALIENALRHLDDFGMDPNSTAVSWLYQNARFIWSNYEYIKYCLNVLEFTAILTTASNYMRSPRFLKA